MGLFDRLKTGWTLSMDSLRVLRDSPELALFPLVGGLAGAVYVALLFGGSLVVGAFETDVAAYAVLFVLYLGSTFIAAFFNAGLVYSAREAFRGGDPSLRSGIAAAWRHRGPLFVWAVAAAVVGLVVRLVEQQDNLVARVVALVFSAAWSVVTYFVVPVIVFEDVGALEMFRRSGDTFRNTWGETAGASFGVGLVNALFVVVGLVVAGVVVVALGSVAGGAGFLVAVAVAAVVMLGAVLFGSALGAVAKTALYVYATEGTRPPQFGNVDFERGAR